MANPEMTADEYIDTLKVTDFTIENLIQTIKNAYNEGYSNGSTYAFKTCGAI